MSDARFYCPDLSCGEVVLPAQQGRHAARSRRLAPGAAVSLLDGQGSVGRGVIARIENHSVAVEIREVRKVPFDSPVRLTLATACPKTARQAFLVEKATELWVWAMQPLLCHHSVAIPGASLAARWRRLAIEAAKQCGAAWIPRFGDGQSVESAARGVGEYDLALIAAARTDAQRPRVRPLAAVLPDPAANSSLLALIGPEGGWTDDEIALLTAAGAVPVSLGPRVLRVETACIAVAAAVALHVASARDRGRRS